MITLILLLFSTARSFSDSTSTAYITVQISMPGYVAVLDSALLIPLPAEKIPVNPGHHSLRVRHQTEWNGELLDTLFTIGEGESLRILLSSLHRYTLLSDPTGATVSAGGMIIGPTPVSFSASEPLSLRVQMEGFVPVVLEPPLKSLMLVKLSPNVSSEPSIFQPNQHIRRNESLIYMSIGTALVSGTISALAKQHANNVYDEYLHTRDPSKRDETDRYDVIAGVTLFIAEVSFGALGYLLLSQ